MQNDINEHIQNLMDRFFEGETSNAEEKELYLFFTQKDLPKQFEPYRKMFGFFESGMADETTKPEVSEKKRKVVSFRKIAWTALAVAASLLLVFVIGSRIQKERQRLQSVRRKLYGKERREICIERRCSTLHRTKGNQVGTSGLQH
jgi:hypothetical protein